MTMGKYVIGIDIGGTAVKLGIVHLKGQLIHKWSIPTNTKNNGATIVEDIWHSITDQIRKLKIEKQYIIGIGAGVAGFIDSKNGVVHESVNIGWKNFPLAEELYNLSGLPVFIENDANVAALGERWKGAGQGADQMIVMTLGTGVGGGIIAKGDILSGANGMAGEIGHFIVDKENGLLCNCGKYGCLETIASATGIVKHALRWAKQNPDSRLAKTAAGEDALSAKDVFQLAKEGDEHAGQIVKQAADALGYTIASLGIFCNPSVVLIGGGVSMAGDFLLDQVKDAFRKYALPRVYDICDIKQCELGNDAGIFGGAYLVKKQRGA